jgi:two-component system, NtrC family, response regulator HupR/HoxA
METSRPAPSVPWTEVLNLRVVQAVGQIINRRWNLGLGFGTPSGTLIEGESADRYSTRRPLCELLKAKNGAGHGCASVGSDIAQTLRRELSLSGQGTGCLRYSCHGGLREAVSPILWDGELLGFVLAGGYTLGSAEAAERAPAGGAISLAPLAFEEARARTPRLSSQDESYLEELVELIAREVTSFCHEHLGARRSPEEQSRTSYDDIIGGSAAMLEVYHLLDKVSGSDSTVLIQGDNGTGKELIAKAIHNNSPRRKRRFLVQNCSAFNDNLLDSELFGHKKGSFTGAISDKPGLFEVADGSTFFLDEIGDMSPSLQVKLLRVLQEGTFIPVGGTELKKVDVRIIAATNRDLKQMVERGVFREDLYYRINVINMRVPPLRERRDDIPALVDQFLRSRCKGARQRLKLLTRACLQRLVEYDWPGNVRELENEIERLVVLSGDERLVDEDLLSTRIGLRYGAGDGDPASEDPSCLPEAVKNLERNLIHEVLLRHRWNKTRAAQELRISRRNLIRKVNKYNLEPTKAP